MLCEYGCGGEGIYPPRKGMKKWCCSEYFKGCPAQKILNSKLISGKKHSEETKKKMSESRKKRIISKETCKKISDSNKGKLSWNTGKHHSEETKRKIGKSNIGKSSWNKGISFSKESIQKMILSSKLSITRIKEKSPTFFKVEEMRYEPGKENEKVIQVHCKNSNCENSLEKGGWFTPTYTQLAERIRQVESINGNGASYLYCSNKCKKECYLSGKHMTTLLKDISLDKEDPWYTSQEYQTWRKHIFNLDSNKCVYCEKPAEHAHHILPQKTHPEFSIDSDNGISCCSECHYKYGHKDKECTTGHLSKLICERIIKINNKIEE